MTENTVKLNGNVEIKNDLPEQFIIFVAAKDASNRFVFKL